MNAITGKDLIGWGFTPGPWFKGALLHANLLRQNHHSDLEIVEAMKGFTPVEPVYMERRERPLHYANFLDARSEVEIENARAVAKAMNLVMSMPTVEKGAIMPDACPAGAIPVGGVVATRGTIHPGYHSADVCCSMAISILAGEHDTTELMDTIQALTHFGPTKRETFPVEYPEVLIDLMAHNPFLDGLQKVAKFHFTTQGDGNHFYFLGRLETTGQLAIVSHHGSRGLGARVYKRGMLAAEKHTKQVATGIPKGHAWLAAASEEGHNYWKALQFVREWTKMNHFMMHNAIIEKIGGRVDDRYWNPHNFVFHRDGLFYHAKGATPSYRGHGWDDGGFTIIPMNMAEPILITRHADNPEALGFAPHGAGRNMSRTAYMRENEASPPEGIDFRFWCGKPDPSEFPDAYKPSASVIPVIEQEGLAHIIDRVLPIGSIMAGDWEADAPWRNKKT